jgi:hypothetical protein
VAAARPLPVPAPRARAGRALALRERESPSSLERLLGCSMSWALHYHGRLEPGLGGAPPPAPGPLLYGKLAHALLARVFAGGALDADAAAARAEHVVSTELAELCESLDLPRYQVERAALRQAVVDSARELGRLLAATGARVRGVELEDGRDLDGIAVGGRADLVLAAPDAVLDLKWSRSANRDRLVAGTALQLAVYAEIFATAQARPEVGYFILRTQELLGEPGSRLPGVQVPGIVPVRATWLGAARALAGRTGELAAGALSAPAADGTEVEARLEDGALVLAPGCSFCALGRLCGQAGCT